MIGDSCEDTKVIKKITKNILLVNVSCSTYIFLVTTRQGFICAGASSFSFFPFGLRYNLSWVSPFPPQMMSKFVAQEPVFSRLLCWCFSLARGSFRNMSCTFHQLYFFFVCVCVSAYPSFLSYEHWLFVNCYLQPSLLPGLQTHIQPLDMTTCRKVKFELFPGPLSHWKSIVSIHCLGQAIWLSVFYYLASLVDDTTFSW